VIAPVSAYGQSKSDAENALLALADRDFVVVCARLPFMFGVQNPSLMGKLIDLINRVPLFPVAISSIDRSMLTYGDAAALLVAISEDVKKTCVINLADPQFFNIETLVRKMQEGSIKTAQTVKIPDFAATLIKKVAPSIGDRLFSRSVLNESNNWAARKEIPIGINREILNLLVNLPLRKM
jgi:dTDP-4-dehydrorhamnose reductase